MNSQESWNPRQKIAVIGTGIAGNLAAYRLAPHHDITVFEAEDRIGGHTNTVDVSTQDGDFAIDTGFIVFNDATYPNFVALLDELGVESQPSQMSFSVRNEKTGLEYNGASLNTLFAQRGNLLRPSFYRMIRDILRFNREAPRLLDAGNYNPTLSAWLRKNRYSREFVDHYIIPMGAAIWSSTPQGMGSVPARFFVRFFHNHGMLSVNDRPTWRVIKGGSHRYVEKLVAGHRDRIQLSSPVESVRRQPGRVEVRVRNRQPQFFDQVFFACHSDQALKMLADPSPEERQVLSAIRYQHNEAVLHNDRKLMPRKRRAWAAWNYHIPDSRPSNAGNSEEDANRVALTYNMNILQGLESRQPFCVTLNYRDAIDPARIIRTIDYAHPIFNQQAVAAQQRHREINGVRRSYFCGAYWRYGFHEDGVVSAMKALAHFQQDQQDEQRYFSRSA